MTFVAVYGGLYPRADDDKGGGKDKDGGGGGKNEGGDKPEKDDGGSGGKGNGDSKAKSTAKATPPPKKEGSWIQNNVELVVAAAVAGLVIIILLLILVWWLLKRRHKKALAAAGEEEGSDSKGGMDEKSAYGADTANYPHFGAGQPPAQQNAMPATFDGGSETHGNADTYQYTDAPEQHDLAMPGQGQGKPGGPLRSITERTEEAEYMQDDPYMQDPDGYDTQSQHGPNEGMPPGQQDSYYPHHVKNSLSDPRNDYYYNEDPAGQRHPQEIDDGSSMYSRQESDVRYK